MEERQRMPRIEQVLTPIQEALFRQQIRDETFREVRQRIRKTEERWRNLARYYEEREDVDMVTEYRHRASAAGQISRQFGD